MQTTKQLITNLEVGLLYSKAVIYWRSHLTMSKLKTILLVSLISFTSLLIRQTLQVQHSCNPMIHWSGELPAECQVAVNTNSDSFDDFSYPRQQELKTPKQPNIAQPSISKNTVKSQPDKVATIPQAIELKTTQDISQSKSENRSNSVGEFVNEHSNDIVGGIAGIAGGVASVAAASATAAFSIPVAGAVAIGLGLWFLIRSAL